MPILSMFLLADWQLAINGEEVFKIEPLK